MWNVDKYKSELETEEHWALREKFMKTHQDKFPEEKLVTLTRVFANIEFLGCKYPEETMQLVADMSKGICDEYREKKKGRIQRTLILASDAAALDVRGLPYGLQTEDECGETGEDTADGPIIDFRRFILHKHINALATDILMHSADKNVNFDTLDFCFPDGKNTLPEVDKYCEVRINNNFLSSGTGSTVGNAKVKAAEEGLSILSTFCYTIQVKCICSCRNCSPKVGRGVENPPQVVAITNGELSKVAEVLLPQDNIGTRMMQKMGWTGTGLGKNMQGIQSPVKVTPKLALRAGFGCEDKIADALREIISDFVVTNAGGYIVFCIDPASSAEIKTLLKIANMSKLRTQTFVKEDRIHVVVSKKMELPAILEELLACGGQNDLYLLIPPSRVSQGRSTEETEQFIAELFNKKEPTETVSDESVPEITSFTKGKKLKGKAKNRMKGRNRSAGNNDLDEDLDETNVTNEKNRGRNRLKEELFPNPGEQQSSPTPGKLELSSDVGSPAPLLDLPDFILFVKYGPNFFSPAIVLLESAKLNMGSQRVDFCPALLNSVERSCEIQLNGQVLSSVTVKEEVNSGKYSTKKLVKALAAEQALRSLRRTCYTIKEKVAFFSSTPPIGKDQLVKSEEAEYMEINPSEIPAEKWLNRKPNNRNEAAEQKFKILQRQLHIPFKKILTGYIDSDTFDDLVFAPEFDNDERRVLHMLAQSFSLDTKSFGSGAKRHIVISKRVKLPFLLDMLLASDGENGKYLVIPPTG